MTLDTLIRPTALESLPVVGAQMRAYRAAREERRGLEQQQRYWAKIWADATGLQERHCPQLMECVDLPALVSSGTAGTTPMFRRLLFLLPAAVRLADVAHAADRIGSLIGRGVVVVEPYPVPAGSLDTPREALTLHGPPPAVILSHELMPLGAAPHLNAALDDETLEFAVRAAIISAAAKMRLPAPVFLRMERIDDDAGLLTRSVWHLAGWATVEDFAGRASEARDLMRCQWLRFCAGDTADELVVIFGQIPSDATLLGCDTASAWSGWIRDVGVVGSDGSAPGLVSVVTEPAAGLWELRFRYPPGIDTKQIVAALDRLKALSGCGYIEMIDTPSDQGHFTLLAGNRDPLTEVFAFSDYAQQILQDPQQGQPRIDWTVGIRPDGTLLQDCWDSEEPHLLIAGSSGSGKSTLIHSLVCQMLRNNHPDDVRLWLVEPKNELHPYKHVAHVTRFLDYQVTSESPSVAFAALMREAVNEMASRYTAFAEHPAKPQKLAAARELARSDPDTASHLGFPYVFIVVEECAAYFARPVEPSPEDKKAYADFMHDIQKLARESRAAGIHLLLATQHPTKENMSMTLKQQCRRIGLPTSSTVASMVIIDQPGLETLKSPGRGMITTPTGLAPFRGLLLSPAEGWDEIVEALPRDDIWPKLPPGISANGA